MDSAEPEPFFSVLGAVRVRRGDAQVPLGAPQQRALLAMLLLRRNDVVDLDEIVDGLWGEEPPRTAAGTVRSHVYRLRRALGPRIATHGQGYLLHLAPGALDLDVFDGLVAEARTRTTAEGTGEAAELLARALRLWQGAPLAGLPGPYAGIHRERLSELRLSVLLERIELDLRLGRHARLVPELTGLCAQYPLHGRLRELAGLALARTGRTAPTAQDERPSRPHGNPGTPPAAEPPNPASLPARPHDRTPPLPRPAQLPFPPDRLVGRAEAVADLLGTLTTPRPGSITVAAVTGTGGVGKSALAVHVAHRLREHYPDGQLYAHLRGTSADPADPAAVLAGFLQALGLHERDVPEGPHERAALFRTTVADRRILLVLDDARDTAQAEALLPGSATCAVLVTARATLDGLQSARRVRLEPLAVPDALAVLGEVAGRERIAADPGQAQALAERCGGLPLALRLAGARLAARPSWSLSDFVRLLDGSHPAFPALPPFSVFPAPAGSQDGVTACIRPSYDLLDDEEARLFRLLALPRRGATDIAGAAALGGLPPARAGQCLERLTGLGLLESPRPGVYRQYPLLRMFAAERSREEDRPEEQAVAITRFLDHLLAEARAVHAAERPGHRVFGAFPPEPCPGRPDSRRRLVDPEHDGALAVAAQILEAVPSAVAVAADLALAVEPLLEGSYLWAESLEPLRLILRTARDQGHLRAAGRAGHVLGSALAHLGRLDEADRTLDAAEHAARAVGDDAVHTGILNRRAHVCQYRAQWHQADVLHREAVTAAQAYGSDWACRNARARSVKTLLSLSRPDEAAEVSRTTLASAVDAGDRGGQAYALYNLGVTARHQGRTDEAVDRHRQGAELGARSGSPTMEAMNLVSETAAQLAGNRLPDAVECGERAVEATRRLRWHAAEVRALRLLGTALAATGDRERARVSLNRAADALTLSGLPRNPRDPLLPPDVASL
ncbi:regulatory protein AfsR [Streptomyces lavendulae subsp. lavendulae]|uniref:AfsR/SARP family transcriptional regulator n=1 Tax=Streptomyces lavendulae TaxID=1914 RepID=UPI0024A14609|nr:AfsR/SARP family transcriptional regulator [Streptomyces lavendulae]GLV87684.1 regulatory protein AfsR [Streptomyces lavendulae subsp. lavendulae]